MYLLYIISVLMIVVNRFYTYFQDYFIIDLVEFRLFLRRLIGFEEF